MHVDASTNRQLLTRGRRCGLGARGYNSKSGVTGVTCVTEQYNLLIYIDLFLLHIHLALLQFFVTSPVGVTSMWACLSDLR